MKSIYLKYFLSFVFVGVMAMIVCIPFYIVYLCLLYTSLLQYIRPGAQNQMEVILAEEAKRIKNDNVNSAFFQTSVRVWPQYGRVEIRGVLKTWIGDSKPFTDIKHYILILKRENGVTLSLIHI